MTRFARAKGSKASNERTPDDATPWEVMKEQLLQSQNEKKEAGKRREAENQRIANYEKFLKEHKVSKRKATWCDFPEQPVKRRLLPEKHPNKKDKETPGDHDQNDVSHQVDNEKVKNKKKKKQKHVGAADDGTTILSETAEQVKLDQNASEIERKQKNKKKKKRNLSDNEISLQAWDSQELKTSLKESSQNKTAIDVAPTPNDDQILPGQETSNKRKKKKKQNPSAVKTPAQADNSADLNDINVRTSPYKNFKSNDKDNSNNNMNKKKKQKVNGKPVRRKEINDNSFQLIINGKEVELVRFDGFPIMKKDAERLTELKQSMIKKGIPKSEVQRTMKLERRRAEKALARVKRDVCYNCRKGGHNLSDCPELKSKIPGVEAADGVCFKCGSTEHRQFECKVQRDKEFRFATCFICREPGHIARQCPDNPKGLYPNGGSCKLCGDVTHLRKDCPTTQGQREETSLKLETLQSADNIEDIGHRDKVNETTVPVKKTPKKIKF